MKFGSKWVALHRAAWVLVLVAGFGCEGTQRQSVGSVESLRGDAGMGRPVSVNPAQTPGGDGDAILAGSVCAPNPCLNNGICLGDGSCLCTTGHSGERCQIEDDACLENNCRNGSICVDLEQGFRCDCLAGFAGPSCDQNIDDCASAPCENGGVCVDQVSGYTCQCPLGLSGVNCERAVRGCQDAPCQNDGACVPDTTAASYTCACPDGFEGVHCETNVDDCAAKPCANESACIDRVRGFDCQCKPGFSGETCQTDIDDCGGELCSSGVCAGGRCCNRACEACEICSEAGFCVDSGQCECSPGATATCGTVHASVGACAARAITCLPEGRWPAAATACAATSVEVCDAARVDEDCDGVSNERPPCEGFTQIDAGRGHTCGVTTGGAVACWGDNEQGQLGDGTRESRRSPVRVVGLPPALQVSAKGGQSCALSMDGAVWCWGDNQRGGAGSETAADQLQPIAVPLPARARSVACAAGGPNAACAVLQSGTVSCWGSLVGSTPTPVDIGMSGIQAVTVGFNHVCGLAMNGTVQCWGSGLDGILGDGTTTAEFDRVTTVSGLSDVGSISAGSTHTCAALGTGAVRCWGLGDNGRLGNGSTLSSSTPVTVIGLSNAVSVGVGEFHSCAVLADGSARCWGANNVGQSGDGSRGVDRLTPVVVENASGVSSVAAGQIHSCAVRSDGGALCWGANASGALGNPEVVGSAATATEVQGPPP